MSTEAATSGAARPTGVLLANLGSPASPQVSDVRRYLREFLSDPAVIDTNRLLWWLVLRGIVLPFRGPASARLYAKVWTDAGSPLIENSRRQAALLADELGRGFVVRLAMRYGEPSLLAALDELERAGCGRILLLPLFPQYSATTTGSLCGEVERLRARRDAPPALQVIPPFYDDPGYVEALAARIGDAARGRRIEHHVFSFHGLPQAYVERGDPYRDQCGATAELLASALGLARGSWTLVFQSRFGPVPWLQPYADEAVPALAREHRRVLIAMPGFTADCLETLEEIGMRLAESFVAAGGEELVVVPALNEHPRWIRTMADLVRRRNAPR